MKDKELRILVTGGNGLLGRYFTNVLKSNNIHHLSLGKECLDITNVKDINDVLTDFRPTHVVNCAAYTNVNAAEIEKKKCYLLNVSAVVNLILVTNQFNCNLIHISTDYVFDGNKIDGLYNELDYPNPLNYYGMTKLIAENKIRRLAKKWTIIRTSWLYGLYGDNFVNKIINRILSNDSIAVVDYEIGSPTYALDLAESIFDIIINNVDGIVHVSNSGHVSRYNLALEIARYLNIRKVVIKPLYEDQSIQVIEGAIRPKKVILVSQLYKLQRHWTISLKEYISRINL